MDFNPDSSSFISGSNSITSNRIISSYFLEQGLKSVSIAHGEHDALVFDDPYTGYAEISYCTDYISYGSDSLDFGSYNRSLKGHKLRIHWRSSIVVENNISRDEVKKINNTKKGLYIPTGFSGNVRYGPFRDMSDESYLSWQNKVGSAGVEMYYKQHPLNVPKAKEHINSKNLFLINKDCNQNLRDLDIEEYDFITLDYMSTAFAICSSSSVPIIYFNIGLTNISSSVIEDFKDRVFLVDIDFKGNIEAQIQKGFDDFFNSEKKYSKKYSYKHSLSKNSISSILDEIL
jgi:hypothetical protein